MINKLIEKEYLSNIKERNQHLTKLKRNTRKLISIHSIKEEMSDISEKLMKNRKFTQQFQGNSKFGGKESKKNEEMTRQVTEFEIKRDLLKEPYLRSKKNYLEKPRRSKEYSRNEYCSSVNAHFPSIKSCRSNPQSTKARIIRTSNGNSILNLASPPPNNSSPPKVTQSLHLNRSTIAPSANLKPSPPSSSQNYNSYSIRNQIQTRSRASQNDMKTNSSQNSFFRNKGFIQSDASPNSRFNLKCQIFTRDKKDANDNGFIVGHNFRHLGFKREHFKEKNKSQSDEGNDVLVSNSESSIYTNQYIEEQIKKREFMMVPFILKSTETPSEGQNCNLMNKKEKNKLSTYFKKKQSEICNYFDEVIEKSVSPAPVRRLRLKYGSKEKGSEKQRDGKKEKEKERSPSLKGGRKTESSIKRMHKAYDVYIKDGQSNRVSNLNQSYQTNQRNLFHGSNAKYSAKNIQNKSFQNIQSIPQTQLP